MTKRVFIGVGHGGKDPGAVGHVKEADANLNMALGMKEELERYGIIVGISRLKDENDPLIEEIKEANAFKPDVAVEIHNNAGGGNGFEVYRQTNSYASKSIKLAKCIEKRVKDSGQYSRGIKTKLNSSGTDYFGWCRQVKAPAVLTEGFFVDNKKDSIDYDTVSEQKAYGKVYALGVLDYFGIPEGTDVSEKVYNYTIQMGAFSSIDGANKVKNELSNMGYHSFLSSKNSLNIVCVGKFETKNEAEITKNDLSKKGKIGFVINL